jgi:hypothetical protein
MKGRRKCRGCLYRPSANDRLGRAIEPCALSVAQEMAPQALAYAENFVGDPCVVMNLLEEAAAATVSEVVCAKEPLKSAVPIRPRSRIPPTQASSSVGVPCHG